MFNRFFMAILWYVVFGYTTVSCIICLGVVAFYTSVRHSARTSCHHVYIVRCCPSTPQIDLTQKNGLFTSPRHHEGHTLSVCLRAGPLPALSS